jgi:hypothetical protein
MKKNKVIFTPESQMAEYVIPVPVPASSAIPEWFKMIPSREPGSDGQQLSKFSHGSNSTVKGCSPFLDALTGGYMFVLAADIEFSFDMNGMLYPNWLADYPLMTKQTTAYTNAMPKPFEKTEDAFKFNPGWRINTPKGYSTLFTHPLNRHDLPFRTFSGIVETDTYDIVTEFPFQILDPKDKTSFILKRGTPICQAIPFKREDWVSEVADFVPGQREKAAFNLFATIGRSYKKQFWQKKSFK